MSADRQFGRTSPASLNPSTGLLTLATPPPPYPSYFVYAHTYTQESLTKILSSKKLALKAGVVNSSLVEVTDVGRLLLWLLLFEPDPPPPPLSLFPAT